MTSVRRARPPPPPPLPAGPGRLIVIPSIIRTHFGSIVNCAIHYTTLLLDPQRNMSPFDGRPVPSMQDLGDLDLIAVKISIKKLPAQCQRDFRFKIPFVIEVRRDPTSEGDMEVDVDSIDDVAGNIYNNICTALVYSMNKESLYQGLFGGAIFPREPTAKKTRRAAASAQQSGDFQGKLTPTATKSIPKPPVYPPQYQSIFHPPMVPPSKWALAAAESMPAKAAAPEIKRMPTKAKAAPKKPKPPAYPPPVHFAKKDKVKKRSSASSSSSLPGHQVRISRLAKKVKVKKSSSSS